MLQPLGPCERWRSIAADRYVRRSRYQVAPLGAPQVAGTERELHRLELWREVLPEPIRIGRGQPLLGVAVGLEVNVKLVVQVKEDVELRDRSNVRLHDREPITVTREGERNVPAEPPTAA